MARTLDEPAYCHTRQNGRLGIAALLSAVSLVVLGSPAPAFAQAASSDTGSSEDGDIIVTARKRNESILKVPVVMSAVTAEQLEGTQTTSITDLPRLVPGLLIGGSILSIGPQVTVRGVGTSSYDSGADQSVSLNIDGLSLNQGLAFGSAMFDVGQVEVLKGPQSLFYGKSSVGGVISLRTADPTDQAEFIARAGYEFEAREARGELILSGPIGDTLKARLATMYSRGEGYFINEVANPIAAGGARAPDHRRNPQPRNFVIRGTVLFEPSSDLQVRLKVNHAYDRTENPDLKQVAACYHPNLSFPFGSGIPGTGIPPAPNFLTPVDPIRFGTPSDCKFDRKVNSVYAIPSAFPGAPNGGTPFMRNVQNFGTLELVYDLSPEISLSSTTAYYKLNSNSAVLPFISDTIAGSSFIENRYRRRELTEELRLESAFAGPLNFSAGAFFEDGKVSNRAHFYRNRTLGFLSPAIVGFDILNDDGKTTIDIKTYSLFGQLRYKVFDQLELSGGVRWSDETRKETLIDIKNGGIDLTPFIARPKLSTSTFSPEFTATYTPTDDLTIFASYKQGYKSGSFDISVPRDPRPITGNINDNSYDNEKVKGFEIGVKSRLLDRQLQANAAFFDYRYTDLQVGAVRQQGANGQIPIVTSNAGKARSYGVDFDLMFRPQAIDGLSLNASVIWNKAKYKVLDQIGCYDGQTIAQGCTLFPINGAFTRQDLSGTRMVRAPEWSANFGFDWEVPVGSGMKIQMTSNNQVTSSYPSYPAIGRPNRDNFEKGFFKTDATIALKEASDRWEVALIGKNLTDKLTATNCTASNVWGGYILGQSGSGTVNGGQLTPIEKLCFPDGPGRSIWLRLTFRPMN